MRDACGQLTRGSQPPLHHGCSFGTTRLLACILDRLSQLGAVSLHSFRHRVEGTHELGQALVATGFGYDAERRAKQAARVVEVIPKIRDIRRGGAAAIDIAWVACGRLDGYWESGLNAWDWAAGSLLVTEAGGFWSCQPGPLGVEQAVAACPGVYDALFDLLQ